MDFDFTLDPNAEGRAGKDFEGEGKRQRSRAPPLPSPRVSLQNGHKGTNGKRVEGVR